MRPRTSLLPVASIAALLWLCACNTAPETPKGLTATPGDSQVALAWTANGEKDLKGYNIHFGTDAANLVQAVFVAEPAVTYTVSGLTNETTWYFALDAEDDSGKTSELSATVNAKPSRSDSTAPTVSQSVPANGATNVSVDTNLVITFSEAMNEGTVQLSITPAVDLAAPMWDVDKVNVQYALASGAVLAHDTTYTVALTGRDLAGNLLGGDVDFSFTTAPPPDTTAPTILSSVPPSGATNYGVDGSISITFSEPMDTASISLVAVPAIDFGEAAWDEPATTVTFSHATPFLYNTAYVLTVDAKDLAGNALGGAKTLTFTTVNPPDTTRPTVIGTSPADASVNVPPGTSLSLTFSEPMDKLATQAAFVIDPARAGTFLWDAEGTLMTFVPSSALSFSTMYHVTLGTGARDLAGNTLLSVYAFAFTTAAAPDTTKPTVVTVAPTNLAIGIERNTNIVVTFSEPMDKLSTQAAFSVTAPAGVTGAFAWNGAGTQMTFNPSVDFAFGSSVSFTLSTVAEDLAGNSLAASRTSSFRILRLGTLDLRSVATLDGLVTNTGSIITNSNPGVLGDSASNTYSRLFFSFSLASGFPAEVRRINSATLYAYQSGLIGDPYGTLGNVIAQSVQFGAALDAADFEATPSYPVYLSTTATTGWKSATVTTAVINDWANRAARGYRSQFRLRHVNNVTLDAAWDASYWRMGEDASVSPLLRVVYEYP